MIQELKRLDLQLKKDQEIIQDIFVCDFLKQDFNLYDTKQIEILTALIRYYATMKEINKTLLNNTNDLEGFKFHTNQLNLNDQVHKKLISIKLFLICNK